MGNCRRQIPNAHQVVGRRSQGEHPIRQFQASMPQLPRNFMESTENPIVVSVQGSWDHHIPTAE